MKRWFYLAVMALPLGGCVLPPAISIASLALDIGSYAATGKSASDHVLSGVVGEDCRMLGVLEGEICREEREFETAVASLEPLRPLPEEAPAALTPTADQPFATARRLPVRQHLEFEPPLAAAPERQPQPIQLASAAISPDGSPLEGLAFLSAGPLRPAQGSQQVLAGAAERELEAPESLQSKPSQRTVDPTAEQLAALAPLPAEEAAQTRGLVYDESGQVLGVAYAFQDPMSDMDGNRDSLSEIEIIDR
ncbi:MAG: hypothetical protein WD489_04355 [Rhodovibrionaceae bacterium]